MNILILGSGGREHAFAWKLAQSPLCENLFIAPGNAGTASVGKNVNILPSDFHSVLSFCKSENIKMIVVGPEDPLVKGIWDFFKAEAPDISVIGPSKNGAQLEGSKDFSKRFMQRHNIPTAKYASFTKDTLQEGKQFLSSLKPPYVLKADGLAAGKGVLILDSFEEACAELSNMLLNNKFGIAGTTVVIEEFLKGIELSVFVLTDGKNYKILPEAKDYKRIGEGDTGLNTGGMGAVSPVPFADRAFMEKVESRIIQPTIKGLQKEGIEYKGFIFIGLMKVNDDPYVIEYNCRMGDPETEVVIPRIKSDLVKLFRSLSDETFADFSLETDERTATTVVIASGGYPGSFEKGKKIIIKSEIPESLIFHAGTSSSESDIKTSGGRVFAVTGLGKSISEALKKSFEAVETINFEGMYFRKDIGQDLINISDKITG